MHDTVVILTGASRGIGAALARELLKPGVWMATISRSPVAELLAHAQAHDLSLMAVAASLACDDGVDAAATHVFEAMPRDAARYLLINNAGTLEPMTQTGSLHDAEPVSAAFTLNVVAPMILTGRFLAATREFDAERRVLNVSSGAGRGPRPGWGVYGSTKAALDMFSSTVAAEQQLLGARAARIVSLAPGVVDTAMQTAIRSTELQDFPLRDAFRQMHDEGQLAPPQEVARRIAAYAERDDFGHKVIDDLRNY